MGPIMGRGVQLPALVDDPSLAHRAKHSRKRPGSSGVTPQAPVCAAGLVALLHFFIYPLRPPRFSTGHSAAARDRFLRRAQDDLRCQQLELAMEAMPSLSACSSAKDVI